MKPSMLKITYRLARQAAAGALVGLLCAGTALAAGAGTGTSTGTSAGTTPPPADHSAALPKRKTGVVPSEQQIDINRASREQLKTLPGIGDAEAGRIIAGRPYVSKYELVSKKVLPEGLYISIRYKIISIPVEQKQTKK